MDRNVFPKFEASDGKDDTKLSRYCHDAELSQLSDPIIINIAEFMGELIFAALHRQTEYVWRKELFDICKCMY